MRMLGCVWLRLRVVDWCGVCYGLFVLRLVLLGGFVFCGLVVFRLLVWLRVTRLCISVSTCRVVVDSWCRCSASRRYGGRLSGLVVLSAIRFVLGLFCLLVISCVIRIVIVVMVLAWVISVMASTSEVAAAMLGGSFMLVFCRVVLIVLWTGALWFRTI